MDQPISGQIITFYSYKGGTGRTMALANVASLLAQRDGAGKVLMIDWDLEAPGLHRYFQPYMSKSKQNIVNPDVKFIGFPGLIDVFTRLKQVIENLTEDEEPDQQEANALFDRIELEQYILPTDIKSLYLLQAGRLNETYSNRVNSFEWDTLFSHAPWLFHAFAGWLTNRYEYVLIDSRTGITDTSGICTMIMPDKLVLVFTPNQQSLTGIMKLAQQAATYRRGSDDLRSLVVFPLVSRVEPGEDQLRQTWRFGDPQSEILGYQQSFEVLLKDVYKLPECNLQLYFDRVQIQHVPRYAYGEEVAVLIESADDRLSLGQAYLSFANWLVNRNGPWEILDSEHETLKLDYVSQYKPDSNRDSIRFSVLIATVLSSVLLIIVGLLFVSLPETQRANVLYQVGLISASDTPTSTPTSTSTLTPTQTQTPTSTQTPIPSSTFTPTQTSTPVLSNAVVVAVAKFEQIGVARLNPQDNIVDILLSAEAITSQSPILQVVTLNDPITNSNQAQQIAEQYPAHQNAVVIYGQIAPDRVTTYYHVSPSISGIVIPQDGFEFSSQDPQIYTGAIQNGLNSKQIVGYTAGQTAYARGDYQKTINGLSLVLDDAQNIVFNIFDLPEIYITRGLAYQQLNNLDAALLDFTRTIDLDPDNAEAYFYRGGVLLPKQEYAAAILDFSRAIALDPQPEYYLALGTANDSINNQAQALSAYRSYLNLAGNSANTADRNFAEARIEQLILGSGS